MDITRRTFISASIAAAAGMAIQLKMLAEEKKIRRILLRSSWQTVNIGDIAHTPGMLALLEKYLPDVEVRLWPMNIDSAVERMLRHRFKKLVIVGGETLKAAFDECDFMLHSSGPSLVAGADLAKWSEKTGRPYGIFGITFAAEDNKTIEIVNGARFIFFRDSPSLQFAREHGVKCPVMEVGQDAAFAMDIWNDEAADKFTRANNLEIGKFICCIPRLRYTPYWTIKPGKPFDGKKNARNEEMKEHDNAPLREAVIKIVKETQLKVLLCPEDKSQMAVGKEMIFDKLPDDVKPRVVWREQYWMPDEALSTYSRSAGLFGLEMHSPIMCIGNGIPALVCRFDEQTSKGIMWKDIGLGDWLFDFDKQDDIARLIPAVLELARDPAAAKAKAEKARDFVRNRQKEMVEILGRSF